VLVDPIFHSTASTLLSQEPLFEFLCIVYCVSKYKIGEDNARSAVLAWPVVWQGEMLESNSIRVFMVISVIAVVDGIIYNINVEAPERRLERFDKDHKGTVIRAKLTQVMMPL
jgi:hypothetical protein